MSSLAAKIVRDVGLGPLALARKIAENAAAIVPAGARLRRCDRVGRGPRTFGRVHVENAGTIAIGDDFAVRGTFGPALLASGPNGTLAIGDRVTVNYGTTLSASLRVDIADDVMIGPYCVVSDTDVPRPWSVPGDLGRAIAIGARAWIAARVVLRPGVRIGAGAVIAAGSVVESDIPDDAIASGVPARVLRVRLADLEAPASGVRRAP